MSSSPAPALTLGFLAGGRATRLGGVDKAWVGYHGQALIERALSALQVQHPWAARLVSANRADARYAMLGLTVVPDRVAGFPGPLAGIDALLAACATPWLLTLPVDLRTIPPDLVASLQAAGEGGAVAHDADGRQPLVALWPVQRARQAIAAALARSDGAVHRVATELGLEVVAFPAVAFGNFNTPQDLQT